MKKRWVGLLAVLMLAGCGTQTDYETMSDVYAQPASVTVSSVQLQIPPEAALQVMENTEGERIYFCENYTVTVQTLPGGDLERTLKTVTGFGPEDLQPIETVRQGLRCIRCAWAAAGEGTDQVGRCMILDDGNAHYCVSVMASDSAAGALEAQWQQLFDSVSLGID